MDEVGQVHVVGTHDLAVARHHASLLVRQDFETLAADPLLWWALPTYRDGPDGDVWYPDVAAGTSGAVPVTTWTLGEPDSTGQLADSLVDLARPERSWVADRAAVIIEHLRANGFSADGAVTRQVLNLAEETGEAVGAYRRWAGQARRVGTAEEFHHEVADVVITAYVLAAEAGFDLDAAIADKLRVVFSRGWRETTPAGGDRSC